MSWYAAIAALALALAACDNQSAAATLKAQVNALSSQVDALEARQKVRTAADAERGATLTVTWTTYNQPPQTTQTAVRSAAACDQARTATIAEGDRLRERAREQVEADRKQGMISNPIIPSVTAVCVQR